VEPVSSEKVQKILSKLKQQNSIFKDKSLFDPLMSPQNVIDRDDKIEEILKYLADYGQKFVEPLISVHGRSGSGKSTVVKLVCNSFDDAAYSFVNLREAKTVFGSANLILSELGVDQSKSAKGLNVAIDFISDSTNSSYSRMELFLRVT